jgi:hypothetical protein
MSCRRAAAAVVTALIAVAPVALAVPADAAVPAGCTPGSLDNLTASQIAARIAACDANVADNAGTADWIASEGSAVEATIADDGALEIGGAEFAGAVCETNLACAVLGGGAILSYTAATKVLQWKFGSNGDNRSQIVKLPGSPVGFTSTPDETTGCHSGEWDFDGTATHVDLYTGYGNPGSLAFSNLAVETDGWGARHYITTGGVCQVELTPAGNPSTLWAIWYADPAPNPQWAPTSHMVCANAAGQLLTVDGPPSTIIPAGGLTVSSPMPACPAGYHPVVGYSTGARPSDGSSAITAAAPATNGTATSTSTDPSGNTTQTTTTITTGENPSTGEGTDSDNCMGGLWSWPPDPVHFVFTPIKCALEWAFFDPNLQTELQGVDSDLSGRAPWNFIIAGPVFVNDVISAFGGAGGGCSASSTGDGDLGLPLSNVDPWCALAGSAGGGSFTVSNMRNAALAGLTIAFLWACFHRAKRLIGEVGPNDPNAGAFEQGGDPSPDGGAGESGYQIPDTMGFPDPVEPSSDFMSTWAAQHGFGGNE